jgi:hypothetical protein
MLVSDYGCNNLGSAESRSNLKAYNFGRGNAVAYDHVGIRPSFERSVT